MPIVLLALSEKILDITKIILFFTNFRRNPNVFRKLRDNKSAQSVIKKVGMLKWIHEKIIRIKEKSTNYQNKNRKIAYPIKKGDKVYLFIKNLKTKKRA